MKSDLKELLNKLPISVMGYIAYDGYTVTSRRASKFYLNIFKDNEGWVIAYESEAHGTYLCETGTDLAEVAEAMLSQISFNHIELV